MNAKDKFTRYAEASTFVSQLKDPIVRPFVQYGLVTAILGRGMEPAIQSTVALDLRWLCEILKAMAEDRQAISVIVAGRGVELKWFPDEPDGP